MCRIIVCFWLGLCWLQTVISEPLEAAMFQGRVSDICLCSCCKHGEPGTFVCSAFSTMSASVPDCDACTLDFCHDTFGKLYAENATFTRASCVERNSTFLKLVPYSFLFFTVVMLFFAIVYSSVRYFMAFRKATYDSIQ